VLLFAEIVLLIGSQHAIRQACNRCGKEQQQLEKQLNPGF
jgi:hypothetical protein